MRSRPVGHLEGPPVSVDEDLCCVTSIRVVFLNGKKGQIKNILHSRNEFMKLVWMEVKLWHKSFVTCYYNQVFIPAWKLAVTPKYGVKNPLYN